MSARQAILARIRKAVGAHAPNTDRKATVQQRLAAPARNFIPERGQQDHSGQIELFMKMAVAAMATVGRASADDVPEAVADYLRRHNLPQRLRRGDDPMIAAMAWQERAPGLELSAGPARPTDEVSLSHALAGVAETGTLVLVSGPDNPTTLNFLPETHIVIVRARDIHRAYEDVWDAVRIRFGHGVLPRTVNMITGPSRTADIGQTMELGAHGPRRLHIIVVDE